jgi:predicted anti-sigma-YlaC factor YlaD
MDCTRIRHAISARLDREDPGVESSVIDAHLGTCAGCRAFAVSAERIHRTSRLAPAPEVPDLTPGILAAIDAEPVGTEPVLRSGTEPVLRSGTEPVLRSGTEPAGHPADTQLALRWILAALALVQIGVAVPALFLGSDAGLPVHTARHLGSFDIAVAVGFLFAAWRPSRIPGLLPVVAALVACLVASSLLDVLAGNTGALGEAHHATDFVGLAVLWLLSRGIVTHGATRRPELA